ncbi:hypothetical protein CEXT_727021 [Caerostris extrusa]|uniref:Uncharacterized protein n=1 Tax=Caerostris extrusa TaxID=172846 RepID=A0AAV4Y368_CAEEX|nr:hypothetical protein CEXT_727021 [Caerostris extrusa]
MQHLIMYSSAVNVMTTIRDDIDKDNEKKWPVENGAISVLITPVLRASSIVEVANFTKTSDHSKPPFADCIFSLAT